MIACPPGACLASLWRLRSFGYEKPRLHGPHRCLLVFSALCVLSWCLSAVSMLSRDYGGRDSLQCRCILARPLANRTSYRDKRLDRSSTSNRHCGIDSVLKAGLLQPRSRANCTPWCTAIMQSLLFPRQRYRSVLPDTVRAFARPPVFVLDTMLFPDITRLVWVAANRG